MPTISVRGANGINLFVNPSDPVDVSDLASCRNVDLSVEHSVQPRRGLLRLDSWPGLEYCETDGNLYTGISGLTGPISWLFPAPSLWAVKPTVGT